MTPTINFIKIMGRMWRESVQAKLDEYEDVKK